jgi:hypothetical protein
MSGPVYRQNAYAPDERRGCAMVICLDADQREWLEAKYGEDRFDAVIAMIDRARLADLDAPPAEEVPS